MLSLMIINKELDWALTTCRVSLKIKTSRLDEFDKSEFCSFCSAENECEYFRRLTVSSPKISKKDDRTTQSPNGDQKDVEVCCQYTQNGLQHSKS